MPASCADREQARPSAADGITPAEEGTELAVDLYERYHDDIFAYLYGMVREREWAQDLAQETFLRVLRARRRLPEVDNRRAWLYRVATNVALNALKRRRRFVWLPWRAEDGPERSTPDVAEQVGWRGAVEAALEALRPGYRAPLLLYAQYGLSTREVAEALGLSEAAARKRIYRASEMFRQQYGEGDVR
jgi:RNA polymerase sigma-70 factor (ECF subfamily)